MWLREQLSSGKGKQTHVASVLNGTYKTRSGEEMMKGQSCLGCQDLLIFFLVSTAVFKCYFWVTSTEVLTAIILHYLSQVFFFLISSSSELLESIVHSIHFPLTISHSFLFVMATVWFWGVLRACSILFFPVVCSSKFSTLFFLLFPCCISSFPFPPPCCCC